MIEALREGEAVTPRHDSSPDAPVVIIATSGSTARPKGVVFTNRSMTAYAASWSVEEPQAAVDARIIGLAPLNTSAGCVQLMHYTCLGCTVFMEPLFDPEFGETPLVVYHGPAEVDVTALIAHCNINLSNDKVPRFVAFSPDPLPRLATGKLSKPAVREAYARAHETLPRVR